MTVLYLCQTEMFLLTYHTFLATADEI